MSDLYSRRLQASVLRLVERNGSIQYRDAASIGATGRTLSAMVKKELLVKSTVKGINSWSLTEAGRASLKEP